MGELERVVLTIDLAEHGLKTDDIGTVVLVHGENQGYEVEFVTLTGETVAVVSSRSQTLFASFPNSVCLVPKLCLGTQISQKLCFNGRTNRVCKAIWFPNSRLGTSSKPIVNPKS